jgi:hypothetical protein
MVYRAAPWQPCQAMFIILLPEGKKEYHAPRELKVTAFLDMA